MLDHKNDFAGTYEDIDLIYGRKTGFGSTVFCSLIIRFRGQVEKMDKRMVHEFLH